MKTQNIFAMIILTVLLFPFQAGVAQEKQKDINDYTREEVLNIPYEKLIELPLEELLVLADIVGVSLDELYEMILNKDVVSASKSKESSFEAPLSTSVVSYDDIMASGARTIEEALRLVPGLIVREKTNGNFDVHIRGNDNLPPNNMFIYSENSITLVMINNRPVYNYVHGGTFWETLPIGVEDIERIEVVRGPSSALYGPNAVSGVINFITKEPEGEGLQVYAHAQMGMQNTNDFGVNIGQRLNSKFGYNVTANYYHGDRSTDLLYSVREGKYYTVPQIDTATFIDQSDGQRYFIYDPSDSVPEMFPDPGLAKNTLGTNLYLYYDHSEDIGLDFSAGYQSSDIISSTMGDNATSMVGRLSNTQYADIRSHLHGFKFQTNIMNGWQDIIREDTGFKVDALTSYTNIEYDKKWGKFEVRPGISYQYSAYNDLEYLKVGQGFLNGKREFNLLAASLRMEYKPIKPLRLIAALRGEKYNTHDDLYFSYQFIGSYNVHNQHLFRFVASRANRSPFLVDSYADYEWNRVGRPNPGTIYFQGTQNLDLLTTDQFEIGFRSKPSRAIQLDIEAFYTRARDFGALYPDSVNLNATNPDVRPYARMVFRNIDLESTQIGVTSALTYVVNTNFFIKLYGTFQQTQLKNAIATKQEDILATMLNTAFFTFSADPANAPQYYTGFPAIKEDKENEATPSFYGGFVADYKMLDEKLRINLNTYFMTQQRFENKYDVFPENGEKEDVYQLNNQINLNVKISYNVVGGLDIFVNARNLLSQDSEFAFLDEIKPIVLGGISYQY